MKVIFFDGICGLCNGFVDFMLKIDQKSLYKFSPLQSEFAKANLPPGLTQNLSSIVLLEDGQIYTKSAAVIKILIGIGGIWKVAVIGKIIPTVMADNAYDLVAQKRYKIFGRKESCRIPTPEEKNRFVI